MIWNRATATLWWWLHGYSHRIPIPSPHTFHTTPHTHTSKSTHHAPILYTSYHRSTRTYPPYCTHTPCHSPPPHTVHTPYTVHTSLYSPLTWTYLSKSRGSLMTHLVQLVAAHLQRRVLKVCSVGVGGFGWTSWVWGAWKLFLIHTVSAQVFSRRAFLL